MNVLRELADTLLKMFIGDAFLTVAILIVVSLTGLLTGSNAVPPLVGGAVLFLGCIVVLVACIALAGKRHRSRRSTTLR